MGWGPCRNCGELRKIGDFMTDDGEHVPPCHKCADAAHYLLTAPLQDVVSITGRGMVATLELSGPAPSVGATITRVPDGATWILAGIEHYAIHGWNHVGAPVGFLLRGDTPFARDDVIEWVNETAGQDVS